VRPRRGAVPERVTPRRTRAVTAWVLSAPWPLWAVIRFIGLDDRFPLAPLVAFTPYAAIGALVAMMATAALRRWLAAACTAAAAVALLAAVLPRAVGGSASATSTRLARVLTANVSNGRASPEGLVRLVRAERPDVLSVQELTPEMVGALDAAGLRAELPHRVMRPRSGAAGTGVYARVPLERRAPPPVSTFATTSARLRLAGLDLEVVAVHVRAPTSPSAVTAWRTDLGALPAAEREGPVRVLAGDFNATLDNHSLRRVLARGYVDAAAEAGAGLQPTWPSGGLLPPLVAIDHVIADRRCRVGRVAVRDLAGSDHRALVADLVLPP
jgi:endonuclease/exonuclease/phosphatase (EEP) superfamily protein YafD